ncbi:ubiquinone biosynthesis hydrox [Gautieria morchelliformis]|nr:ubiquinone biosynthesis hydrox [Gautieria morchelliformis]
MSPWIIPRGRGLAVRGQLDRVWRKTRYGTFSNVNLEEVDVAIVGGGPVGLALACALSSSHNVRDSLRVALIERGDLSEIRSWSPDLHQFSNRVSSITNASKGFLTEIGAWEHVDTTRTAPIEEMQIWDSLTDSRITFSASDIPAAMLKSSDSEIARLTENLNLQRALLRRLETQRHVSLIDKTKVDAIYQEEREEGGWPVVRLANGRQFRVRLLIGADGSNSPVRSYANISSFGWSYDTQAVVATLSHAPRTRTEYQNPNTTAFQRFLPTGPIAFLPLSPTTSSLVWSTKPPLAATLLASESSVLSTMVNAAFRLPEISIKYLHEVVLEAHNKGAALTGKNILDEVKWREMSHSINSRSAYSSCPPENAGVGIPPTDADMLPPLVTSIQQETMASFPVRLNHADTYAGEGPGGRTVLVGDAAHTVHPLAGQGLNMGLADVQALSRCIDTAVLRGADIGSETALLPYSRERYLENHKILSVTDKLHKLYSATLPPVVWARSVGLEVLNELSIVKGALMLSAGARRHGEVRADAALWNFAANASQTLFGGVDLAKLLAVRLGGLASLAVNDVTKLLRKS